MEILYFCTTWGQKNEDWEAFCKRVKQEGYDGIETSFPPDDERQQFLDSIDKYQLALIGQHWETTTIEFVAHKAEYAERLRLLASLEPLFINAHTGKDHFNFNQNLELLHIAEQIAIETGVCICHETHRGRFAFAAHITRSYLEKSPLDLTLDVSHWCCVAESLLQDQKESLNLALDRTRHIHARVGSEHGPQVSDFTLPELEGTLQFHLNCWDRVVDNRKQSGKALLTITTEFGPPPYMQNVSQVDARKKQWKLNADMMNMLKDRYN